MHIHTITVRPFCTETHKRIYCPNFPRTRRLMGKRIGRVWRARLCGLRCAPLYLPAMPVIRGRRVRAREAKIESAMRILHEREWRRIRLTMDVILCTYSCDIYPVGESRRNTNVMRTRNANILPRNTEICCVECGEFGTLWIHLYIRLLNIIWHLTCETGM